MDIITDPKVLEKRHGNWEHFAVVHVTKHARKEFNVDELVATLVLLGVEFLGRDASDQYVYVSLPGYHVGGFSNLKRGAVAAALLMNVPIGEARTHSEAQPRATTHGGNT